MDFPEKTRGRENLGDLEKKSLSVRTGAGERALGIVAKNAEGADKLRGDDFIVFELEGML